MVVAVGLLAALSYGTADFLGGLASKRNPAVRVLVLTQSVGLLVYLAAVPALPSGRFTAQAWRLGALGGLAGAVGIGALYRGLARAKMGVVAPLSALTSAMVPVAFGFLTGERPAPLQLVGLAMTLPAVALISSPPDRGAAAAAGGRGRRLLDAGVLHGLVSGAGIGLFLVALAATAKETGPWPLVASRLMEVTVFGAAVAASRTSPRPAPGSLPLILGAGVLGMTANLLYLLGTRLGLVSIVAVVSSLYPGATVVLARAVLRERLSPVQVVGLVLGLAGVAAMAVG